MSQQLQIWESPRVNSPTKEGVVLHTINFWTQDGVQFFTLIDSSLSVELVDENGKQFTFSVSDFKKNDIITVTAIQFGKLEPAGTSWSQPADKIKRTPAKSGVTKSARQRINFSGLISVTAGEPPIGLSTL